MTNIGKYVTTSHALGQAAIETLTRPEVTALRDELVAWQTRGWHAWQIAHNRDIHQYTAATPRVRKQNPAWQAIKGKLILAYYYECERAAKVLALVADPELHHGGDHNGMVVTASDLYWDLSCFEPEPWPFAGESPFGEA